MLRQGIRDQLRGLLRSMATSPQAALSCQPAGTVRSDEIALEFENLARAYVGHYDEQLSKEQKEPLRTLDSLFSSMSGDGDSDLWSDAAVLESPVWKQVWRLASVSLVELGWELGDTESNRRLDERFFASKPCEDMPVVYNDVVDLAQDSRKLLGSVVSRVSGRGQILEVIIELGAGQDVYAEVRDLIRKAETG